MNSNAILASDPHNRAGAHPVRKLEHVPAGDGQWRRQLGRFRFRYDIEGQTVWLKACTLRPLPRLPVIWPFHRAVSTDATQNHIRLFHLEGEAVTAIDLGFPDTAPAVYRTRLQALQYLGSIDFHPQADYKQERRKR